MKISSASTSSVSIAPQVGGAAAPAAAPVAAPAGNDALESAVLQPAQKAIKALPDFDAAHPDASVNRRIELLILTSRQSAGLKAMFGTPAGTDPLTQDASTSRTDDPALKALRSQMVKKP